MIVKLLKSTYLQLFIIPSFLFLFFVFSYNTFGKTIPVSYWDEFLWVGRSYFFEFYIHGDFKNRIWQSQEAYDQPKLAEYAYGAWLYPFYLKGKNNNKKPFDYVRFLIKNGFYEIDENYITYYSAYKNISHVIRFDESDVGFSKDYLVKYGVNGLKPIHLIYQARLLNLFLLTGAVIFAYFFALQFSGRIFAVIFSLFYGSNSLIIDSGLKAHSEALFLFTFNAALLFMSLYFFRGRKILYLSLFSLFAGLCISTKLNGIMLVITFFVINTILFFVRKEKKIKYILSNSLPVIVSFIVFVSLNPFTFSDPVKNVYYMFDWRMKVASVYQANTFKEALLPDGITRIKKIFEHFYFADNTSYFNGLRPFEQLSKSINYRGYMIVSFTIGLLYSLKLVFNKNIPAIIVVCSFITVLSVMSYYLVLDWERYYAHLSLFFVMFQSFGTYLIAKYGCKYAILFVRKENNKTGFPNRKQRLLENLSRK